MEFAAQSVFVQFDIRGSLNEVVESVRDMVKQIKNKQQQMMQTAILIKNLEASA